MNSFFNPFHLRLHQLQLLPGLLRDPAAVQGLERQPEKEGCEDQEEQDGEDDGKGHSGRLAVPICSMKHVKKIRSCCRGIICLETIEQAVKLSFHISFYSNIPVRTHFLLSCVQAGAGSLYVYFVEL